MERKCFLIAPIGEDGSEARKRTDKLEKRILAPVLKDLGISIIRADRIPDPGMITRQIMENLVHCDLVISDITESNPNVFYEMGIRHVLRSPIIHMKFSGYRIPFDNSDFRAVDYSFDVDAVEKLTADLPRIIEAALHGETINPFSNSTDSFVVQRNENAYFKLRSLDIVNGYSSFIETIRGLLDLADTGTEYWFQSSQGTSYPENGSDIFAAALAKGASVRAVVAKSPFATRMMNDFKALSVNGMNIDYALVDRAETRFFGVNDMICLMAPAIDGFYGAVVIKDRSIVRHMRNHFEETYNRAKGL